MNRDEALWLACEAAGLEWLGAVWLIAKGPPRYVVDPQHPALPAYVASLLVAICIKQSRSAEIYRDVLFRFTGHDLLFAPPWGQLCAALVALGKITLEQALKVFHGS